MEQRPSIIMVVWSFVLLGVLVSPMRVSTLKFFWTTFVVAGIVRFVDGEAISDIDSLSSRKVLGVFVGVKRDGFLGYAPVFYMKSA